MASLVNQSFFPRTEALDFLKNHIGLFVEFDFDLNVSFNGNLKTVYWIILVSFYVWKDQVQ